MRIRQNHRAHLTALPSHHAPFLPHDFYYTMGMECLALLSTGPALDTTLRCDHFNETSVRNRSITKNEKEKRLFESRRRAKCALS